jgi:hypothetical protein
MLNYVAILCNPTNTTVGTSMKVCRSYIFIGILVWFGLAKSLHTYDPILLSLVCVFIGCIRLIIVTGILGTHGLWYIDDQYANEVRKNLAWGLGSILIFGLLALFISFAEDILNYVINGQLGDLPNLVNTIDQYGAFGMTILMGFYMPLVVTTAVEIIIYKLHIKYPLNLVNNNMPLQHMQFVGWLWLDENLRNPVKYRFITWIQSNLTCNPQLLMKYITSGSYVILLSVFFIGLWDSITSGYYVEFAVIFKMIISYIAFFIILCTEDSDSRLQSLNTLFLTGLLIFAIGIQMQVNNIVIYSDYFSQNMIINGFLLTVASLIIPI